MKEIVDPKNVVPPLFCSKHRIMKQYGVALSKEGEFFKYMRDQFPALSKTTLNQEVFVSANFHLLDEGLPSRK